MRKVRIAIILTAFLCETQGFNWDWPKWGKCPDLEVEQEFAIEQYMGTWYVQAGYNIEVVQGKGQCNSAHYRYNSAESEIDVCNKEIALPSNRWVSVNLTAVPVDPSKNEGKLEVTIPNKFGFKAKRPYWVLGTDYVFYSVVYSCEDFFFFFHCYDWMLLSREPIIANFTSDVFYFITGSVLRDHNIDPSTIDTKIVQTNCNV